MPWGVRLPSTGPQRSRQARAERTPRRRLELLVDDAATVDAVLEPDHDGGWVRVVIRMPASMKSPLPAHTAEPA